MKKEVRLKVEFEDQQQDLISMIIKADPDLQVMGKIEGVAMKSLEYLYKGEYIDISTLKIGCKLGILDFKNKCTNYIRYPISKISKLPKVLDLILKGKFYDGIEAGIKKEEYRESKPFYISRLCPYGFSHTPHCDTCKQLDCNYVEGEKVYDAVRFHRGYTNKTMTWEINNISFGTGKKEWGAPDHKTFIIELGNKIKEK